MRWDRTAQIHVNANGCQGSWWRKSLKRQADNSASARGREVNLATSKLDSKSPISLIVVAKALPGQLCQFAREVYHRWPGISGNNSTSLCGDVHKPLCPLQRLVLRAPQGTTHVSFVECTFRLCWPFQTRSFLPWSHAPLSNKNNFPISHQILAGWKVQTSSPPTVSGLALKRLGFSHVISPKDRLRLVAREESFEANLKDPPKADSMELGNVASNLPCWFPSFTNDSFPRKCLQGKKKVLPGRQHP